MGGKEFKMKKVFVTVIMAVVVIGMFVCWLTPVTPHHYTLHVVRGGETVESIIKDANANSSIDYDIREATATAVAKSKEMEGGATSRQLKVGDRVAVPIYR